MDRFWSKVDRSGNCWEWQAAKDRAGYGLFWDSGNTIRAHRLAYNLEIGPIPEGMYVCHHCDNPSCVRPAHLFVGDHALNMRDKMDKGRVSKGEDNGRAKLTENQVKVIKRNIGYVSQVELARMFGVSQLAISHIKRNRNWAHVE